MALEQNPKLITLYTVDTPLPLSCLSLSLSLTSVPLAQSSPPTVFPRQRKLTLPAPPHLWVSDPVCDHLAAVNGVRVEASLASPRLHQLH